MRRFSLVVSLLAVMSVAAPSFLPDATSGGSVVTAAQVKCPGKIGKFRNEQTRLGVGETSL